MAFPRQSSNAFSINSNKNSGEKSRKEIVVSASDLVNSFEIKPELHIQSEQNIETGTPTYNRLFYNLYDI